MTTPSLSEAALRYADLGYPVFPCVPGGKAPLTKRGFKDATTDTGQIEAWWTRHPDANIGIATAGLLVVDVDGDDNRWLDGEEEKCADLARGALSLTPGGGRHYVFRQPEGRAWGNTSGRLAPKVDTRANGGYIVAPPSVIGGKAYRWAETLELDAPPDALPKPPDWLIDLLDGNVGGPLALPAQSGAESPHVAPTFAPCSPQCEDSAAGGNMIPSGQRNATLARLAGTMRRVGMAADEILAALVAVNRNRCQPQLPDAEVATIAASVARYEPDQVAVAFVENHWAQDGDKARAPYVSAHDLCRDHKELRKPVIHGLLREGETMNVIAAPKTGKALAIDTPILTDNGWLTMGDARPGMKVHACDGTLTEVVAVSEVMDDRPCYRVTTRSGARLVADENHLWLVKQRDHTAVVTTKELSLGHQGRRWLLPVAGPLVRKRAELPLDPWLLGYWLGNGTAREGGITINTLDIAFIHGRILQAGFDIGLVTHKGGATTFTVIGLKPILREMRLLNDKRIPHGYLTASLDQRAELLAGLLDSDGYAATMSNGSGAVEFCTTSQTLAEQTVMLVRSLGWKASIGVGRAKFGDFDCGPKLRVTFAASRKRSPFLLPRKTDALPTRPLSSRSFGDAVVSVEPVPSVPVRCIQVAHPSGTFLAGESLTVTHNSWLVLNLGLSVVTGMPWLEFPTEPGRVLLIDNELHAETLANRIPRVAEAMRLPRSTWKDGLHVQSLRGRLEDLFRMEAYFQALPEDFFKLIILDAFYRFMPRNMDENDNGTMANLYNVIDRCAAKLKAGFVLIHHTTKGLQSGKSVTDVGAGAGSQSRAADCHFILRPHEEDGCLSVDAVARSWPPPEPFVIRKSFPLWVPDHDLDPADLKKLYQRSRKRADDEDGDEPEKPKWTPETFVERFIGTEPKTKAAVLAAANDEGLSDYGAGKLLRKAEATGLIHRWHLGGNRPGFATTPQEKKDDESKNGK